MSEIKYQPFLKIIKDSTSKFTKIKKQDYLVSGKFRIIDQGQKFIAGYTNNLELINNWDEDIIIFGDHTRVIKYIDFPIAIGADGVKVLKIDSTKADTKYIYYFLKSVKLHNAGYS
ncbi:MAG: restriction endonuclease subunit S, partial [Sulfurimonas sp.]|nr:restriction endonuclease subunit S [Sulfurimonas sp.]